MIIVKIIGGLGNQLFQYAAARRLSMLRRTSLKLDITGFAHYNWHAYSLRPFRIEEVFASPEEIQKIKGRSISNKLKIVSSLNRRINPYYQPSIFQEPNVKPYDPGILTTPENVYLDGYWQSEKYFAEIDDIIRREFTVKYPQDAKSKETGKIISCTQSVSLHVRRGNYVSNPQVNKVHGTCCIEYYQESVKKIAGKLGSPHLFVFSDDIAWVRANLRFNHPTTYVDHNDASRDYEDLRLMSLCKHHIIANSSLSWWGAWLSTFRGKIVFAPAQWFRTALIDTRDLIPDSWIRVPNNA